MMGNPLTDYENLRDMKERVPGIYKAIDKESLDRLISNYSEEIEKSRKRGREFLKHKEEYLLLSQKLDTLSDKVTHQVVIPFTTKAFMPGRLVHTNEIMVLLGDNWFVERSAKQAREICERRLKSCDESLESIKKEIGLYESWLRESSQLGATCSSSDGEGQFDLCEPYDEEELKQWRVRHKESVKKQREKIKSKPESLDEAPEYDEFKTDEEYWKILDQREMEEELNEYLSKQKEVIIDENSDTSLSSSESDESSASSSETKSSSTCKRKVSFGSVINHHFEEDLANIITFEHTEHPPAASKLNSNLSQLTPGDLVLKYGQDKNELPKSILKQTLHDSWREEERTEDVIFSNDLVNHEPAISDLVFERISMQDQQNPKPNIVAKKQSLFKQNRLKK